MFFFIKTFGCQMNIVDSQIVSSILINHGFYKTDIIQDADIILINTCSVRAKPEETLFKILNYVKFLNKSKRRIVGILGCMAQRLGDSLLKYNEIDFVAGTDSYRKIPFLINESLKNNKSFFNDLILSENYEDIIPQYDSKFFAYIPISRGCNNFCTYCVVPFTRGQEKNRDVNSIIKEVESLIDKGYKEITFLGENVNLYKYESVDGVKDFADLLDLVASISKNIRIRFLSSYPGKFFDDKLINVISKHKNICNYIHLPLQSGSDKILKLMNRHYSISEYLALVDKIKTNIIDCEIGTDIISGFCNEDDNDHRETLEVIKKIKFSQIFSFSYSERPGTYASKYLKDNVPSDIKVKRVNEVSELQHKITLESGNKYLNNVYTILVEGYSKKSKNALKNQLYGRTEGNRIVVFNVSDQDSVNIGDFINVKINDCSSTSLFGEIN